MSEWIQLGIVFLSVTVAVLAVLLWRRRRQAWADDRLRAGREDADERPNLVLGPFTEALSSQLPLTGRARLDLQKELRLAGFYRRTALLEYTALRTLLVLVPLVATGVIAALAPADRVEGVLLGGALVTGLGFSLPRLYLALRARARARQIERGLPLAIDLLTLCLTAGQNLLAALEEVSRELQFSNPVLAQELAIAHHQAELHSLEHAMQQWAERVHVPDVTNLALLLTQSERLGTDAAGALSELATNFRTSMRQRAEAQANRTNFWMLLPSVFCFWIASAIVLIGPAYLQFFQYRDQAAQYFGETRRNIDLANQRGPFLPVPNAPRVQRAGAPEPAGAAPAGR